MSDRFLPYGRQSIDDDDIAAVAAALRSDFLTTGPLVGQFEEAFARASGAVNAVACNSGTAALHDRDDVGCRRETRRESETDRCVAGSS
jgi:dTDP-4-amino-4,6-dideoxygalactose transaminase